MADRNSRQNQGSSEGDSEFRDYRNSGGRRSGRPDFARPTIQLNRPMLTIELERNPAKYYPGEVLIGEYKIDIDPENEVKAVECSVIWKTTGKGDEDVGVHFFERRPKSTLGIDQLRKPHRISTVLPQSPLSYAGDLIQITWCVRLRVFVDEKQILEDFDFQLGNVTLSEYERIDKGSN